jgi:hypothetical protein
MDREWFRQRIRRELALRHLVDHNLRVLRRGYTARDCTDAVAEAIWRLVEEQARERGAGTENEGVPLQH